MNEQYHLAVDVGTSRVAAATARLAADGSILTTPFALGRRSDSVSTVVFVAEDGQLLVGDAAERRGVAQPDRLIREFKRSVGDEIPLVVAGRSIPAEQLYAHTVAMVVEQVTEREGARPDSITLTHPATWGPHRLGLILAALEVEGVGEVELISEPEAAARSYEFYRPLAVGQTLAVYDLGGGTFDAVLLRKDASGAFALVGNPVGIDNLGGADFDDAVLRHVLQSAKVIGLDPADPDTRLALAQLRRECVDAKEALSFDSDATIPVLLPTRSARIRLTRSEFESMIDPSLEKTINALDDALEEGGVDGDDIECILLIGGSSRIPLVTQKLSERFDRPTAIDADPKSSIALGAALTGLVRHNDRDLGVGSELALIEPTADAALELFQPAGAVATLAAPVNAAAPKTGKVHTLALAGGAVLIAGAIVFGSTFTAGSGLFFTPTASTVKPLVDWSKVNPTVAAPPAPDAAAPGPVAESAPQDQTDSRSPATQRRAPQKTTETRETTNVKTISDPAKPSAKPTPSNDTPSPKPTPSTTPAPTGTDPSPEPTQSADPNPPVEPSDPPVEPSDPPVEPSDPPVEPSDPPVEPSDPPVEPSDPPVEPSQPPADPEPASTPPAEPEPSPSPSPDQPV